jgi:hydrogenase/urease accessory protein HupE
MKKSQVWIAATALSLSPLAAFAHPGHADSSPLVHEMSHALHYIVALVAIGIWTSRGLGRLLRARVDRKRAPR